MDDIVWLWIVVNVCAVGGLLVFVPMATMELTGLVRFVFRLLKRGKKNGS